MLIEAINFRYSFSPIYLPKDELCLKTNNCFGFWIVVKFKEAWVLRGDNFVFLFYSIEIETLHW